MSNQFVIPAWMRDLPAELLAQLENASKSKTVSTVDSEISLFLRSARVLENTAASADVDSMLGAANVAMDNLKTIIRTLSNTVSPVAGEKSKATGSPESIRGLTPPQYASALRFVRKFQASVPELSGYDYKTVREDSRMRDAWSRASDLAKAGKLDAEGNVKVA